MCFSFIKECHPHASGANLGLFETRQPNMPFGSADRMFHVKKLDIKVCLSETFRNRVGGGCPLISLWRTHPGYYFLHLSYFPSGEGDTITSLCHAARSVTVHFCQRREGALCRDLWHGDEGGWGQWSERLGATEWMDCRVEIGLTYCQQWVLSVQVIIPQTWIKPRNVFPQTWWD